MKLRFFYPNEHDKVEFTREELEKLLRDVYEEGRADAPVKVEKEYIPYPSYPYHYLPIVWNSTSTTGATEVWCTDTNSAGVLTVDRADLSDYFKTTNTIDTNSYTEAKFNATGNYE